MNKFWKFLGRSIFQNTFHSTVLFFAKKLIKGLFLIIINFRFKSFYFKSSNIFLLLLHDRKKSLWATSALSLGVWWIRNLSGFCLIILLFYLRKLFSDINPIIYGWDLIWMFGFSFINYVAIQILQETSRN